MSKLRASREDFAYTLAQRKSTNLDIHVAQLSYYVIYNVSSRGLNLNFANVMPCRYPSLLYILRDFQVIAGRRKCGSGDVETDRRVESELSRYSNPSRVFWVGCIRDCGTQGALSPRNTVAEGTKIISPYLPKCFISSVGRGASSRHFRLLPSLPLSLSFSCFLSLRPSLSSSLFFASRVPAREPKNQEAKIGDLAPSSGRGA